MQCLLILHYRQTQWNIAIDGGTLQPVENTESAVPFFFCLDGVEGTTLESPLKRNKLLKEVMNDNDRKAY